MDRLPVSLNPLDMGLIVVASILVAFTATIYPRSRPPGWKPVEAIRHE